MKNFLIIFMISFILSGCIDDKIITKEECIKLGKVYKTEKVLNLRTGKYNDKAVCF
jgi:uncharacterized protein YceK